MSTLTLVAWTIEAFMEYVDGDEQTLSGFISILAAFDGVINIQLRLFLFGLFETDIIYFSLYKTDV